jgi:hypothetical protein
LKVFAAASAQKSVEKIELEASLETLFVSMPVYMKSTDVEVVERSFTAIELLRSMGLTTGVLNSVPGLTPADDDDESDEGADGDLLGMVAGVSASAAAAKTVVKSEGPARAKSLTTKIREASATLNYLLKPTPMKPAGTKAQRKKRQSPIGVTVDLDAPVNLSIIQDLIEEEESYRARSKLSMEAISFTQQSLHKIQEQTAMSSLDAPLSGSAAMGMSSGAPLSFQNPATTTSTGLVSRQRQGDPFYLDSAATSGAEEERDRANRFGTIQLLDSDAEEPSSGRKHKKKQKKHKRSKEKAQSQSGAGEGLMMFGEGSVPTPSSRNVEPMAVYESEDDDDEDGHGSRAVQSKGLGKEFASLARVDITTPLREDEVMPERKHRVVPERSPGEPPSSAKEKKKSKKDKKKKSSKKEGTNTVGDLLDLGIFGVDEEAAAPSLVRPTTTVAPMQSTNPINNAFDDLLGLSSPAPVPTLVPQVGGHASFSPLDSAGPTSLAAQTMQSPKKNGKKPWMKANIKVASASGTPVVDWSKLTLAFRVYSVGDGGGPAAMLVLRIQNNMDTSAVTGLTIDLKDHENIAIGTIDSGSYGESPKIGPFECLSLEATHDIKGVMKTRDCSVPVKITLPASLHLTPEDGLSLDHVANEFSSSEWSSHSAKVEINSGMASDSVKQMLSSLLRAAEVDGMMSGSNTGTLAARSPNGDRVRVMFKIKETSVKVDIKSTNSSLAKALASDVKRLIL